MSVVRGIVVMERNFIGPLNLMPLTDQAVGLDCCLLNGYGLRDR